MSSAAGQEKRMIRSAGKIGKTIGVVLAMAGVVLLGIAAYGGYMFWQQRESDQALRPPVKLASVHLSNFLELEVAPGQITFNEYFSKASASLVDLDKAIVEVKTRATVPPRKNEAIALAYLVGTQNVIRGLNARTRAAMDFNSAIEALKENTKALASDNEYTRKNAIDSSQRARETSLAASTKMSEMADSAVKSIEAVHGDSVEIGKRFGSDAGVDPALFGRVLGALKERGS